VRPRERSQARVAGRRRAQARPVPACAAEKRAA
jgi:hypothetical protein